MKINNCLIALLLLVCVLPAAGEQGQVRPNVILMMADDLANEDLSCYGSVRIKTPNIDKLASEGVRLTSYYAGNPVCSPSRMALLSGSYPARLGWRWGVLGYGFEPKTGMSPRVYTLAEAFRDAGYRTAMTGKWHLGAGAMSPEQQGFSSAYYIAMSNNQNRDMIRDGQLVQKDWDNRTLSQTFAEEAIRVIREAGDQPFFLYLPWTAPHFPADPHPDWQGRSGEDKSARYTDVVQELDHRVGEILDALQKAGKADSTIVIFTSDNGRQSGQQGKSDNPPVRGMKWQSLEGGTRVPCIVRWPTQIQPDSESNAIMAAIDWYPTLAGMCGLKIDRPAEAQEFDGQDSKAMLMGLKGKPSRTELLYWHGKGQATAIRVGDWKLYFNSGEKDPDTSQGPALFNLSEDPYETSNLAGQHAPRVEQMLARAKTLLVDIYSNQIPLGTVQGDDVSQPPLLPQDVWGPWIK